MNNTQDIKYVSISAINKYISYKFDVDVNLKDIYLKGELSNFKYSGKHCYFSLKDENAEISGMFFYPQNLSLNFKPVDGMSVFVRGEIKVYQKKGTYAIIVKEMKQDGVGALYQQFLELKDKLAKEGLFDESRKLSLPEYPERVAIITASTGEAINDIVSTFNRRLPLAKLKLYPALVQGKDAPKDLIRAINEMIDDNWAEVLIIGRGGGSFEDLSCFNDEELVRLLSTLKIPFISAVGHEGDYTICDFVASYRAPTPTGAAMRLTKDKDDVLKSIFDKTSRLKESIKNILINKYQQYNQYCNAYVMSHFDEYLTNLTYPYVALSERLKAHQPDLVIQNWEKELKNLNERLTLGFRRSYEINENNYKEINKLMNPKIVLNIINNFESTVLGLIDKAVLLNPFNVMQKGYTITYQNEKIIKSVNDVIINENLKIVIQDGEILTKPLTILKKEDLNNGK